VQKETKTHKQILKSTSIVGGSQIASILLGSIRLKVIALLLGPVGIGYIGVFQNIIDLVRQSTGFGINFSGIKDVAESNVSNDLTKISSSVKILKTWAFWTGLIGTLLIIIFCFPISKYSFGDTSYAVSIALLSITILIISVSGGQLAVLQGFRKVNLMAKATFYGALLGTLITLPLYWIYGINGIVPGIILTNISGLVLSWWYSRNIKLINVKLTFKETLKGGAKMARLGFFITITGIMATITLYIVRSFLINKMNIDVVGYFQACWLISTLYLGIILNAMLADFFPRLTEVNLDNITCNRLINEQLEIAFLIASPMIVGIIVFSKLIITFLYSSNFTDAVPVLQWMIAGTFFTIISWPLGVLFLAKNKGIFSFITESVWSLVYLLFLFFGWNFFGFNSIGYAYVFAGLIRLVLVYFSTIHLSNFKFKRINLLYCIGFGGIVFFSLTNVLMFSGFIQYFISTILFIVVLAISYYNLNKIININKFIKIKILKKS
jgi:O-antigen/teichoic acid export membrane protein